ncbi:uncharacterized protein OCT59_009720 [Rhizophagus irregularis]|nr:hypothetical protein OCT59_009720 [Rhizophagus irregularis]GBC29060.2 hypothetical protein RIR_jg13095.t1 [Rhizophagus irregularis DAOM 181602=DAOM 197198]CAG8703711.1 21352_t:CDS:2 [Rhizophagus irregularis]
MDDELEELPENRETQTSEFTLDCHLNLGKCQKVVNTYSLQQEFSYKTRRSESDYDGIIDDLRMSIPNLETHDFLIRPEFYNNSDVGVFPSETEDINKLHSKIFAQMLNISDLYIAI